MPLWRLEPNARLHDPRWLDHDFRQPLLVDADNPALARRKATLWYMRRKNTKGTPAQFDHSAFEDEKLYRAARIDISPYKKETLDCLFSSVYPYVSDQEPPPQKRQQAKG